MSRRHRIRNKHEGLEIHDFGPDPDIDGNAIIRFADSVNLHDFAKTSAEAQDLAHGLEQSRIEALRWLAENDEDEEKRAKAKTTLADMGIK